VSMIVLIRVFVIVLLGNVVQKLNTMFYCERNLRNNKLKEIQSLKQNL